MTDPNRTRAAVEVQVRRCREQAAREGWEVVAHFEDRGISGASMLRPGLQQLMAEAAGQVALTCRRQ